MPLQDNLRFEFVRLPPTLPTGPPDSSIRVVTPSHTLPYTVFALCLLRFDILCALLSFYWRFTALGLGTIR